MIKWAAMSSRAAWLVAVASASVLLLVHARRRRRLPPTATSLTLQAPRRGTEAFSAPRRGTKAFSAVFLLTPGTCTPDDLVARALAAVDATEVVSTAIDATVVVATFTCSSASGGFRHGPGQEALHRCHLACDRLQACALVPPGADLLTRDYAPWLPSVQRPVDGGGSVSPSDLASCITVVVTTSPMRCDPELEMLELVFASLAFAGLERCRKLLVCDHKEEGEPPGAESELPTLKKARLPTPYAYDLGMIRI